MTPVKVPKPAGVSNGFTWTQVSTRWDHTLALGSDHNLYAWGWNGDGQLGNTNIPTGTDNSAAYSSKPVLVSRPAGITFTQLSAGRYNSFALGSDNNLYAWGSNVSGRLGDGTDIQRSTPVQVRQPAGVTFSQFSAGDTSCFAISTNGDLYAWGWNGYGRLGDGSSAEDRKTPTLISPPNGAPSGFTWVRVMIRDTHVLAIGSDGNLYSWGRNDHGQLGIKDISTDGSYVNRPHIVDQPTSSLPRNSLGLRLMQDGKNRLHWDQMETCTPGDGTTADN